MNTHDFKIENYDRNKKILIYGMGDFAAITALCLKEHNIPFEAYVTEKTYILPNVPVIGLRELYEMVKEEDIIVLLAVSSTEFEAIYNKLIGREIIPYSIWTLWNSIDIKKVDMSEYLRVIYQNRHFEFLLQEQILNPEGLYIRSLDATVSERCTLKCESCSNLMQYYAHPKDLDIDELKESIDTLLQHVTKIWQLRILGGEPFMNRDFVKIIDAYVDDPRIMEISILSNATIFPSEDILAHIKQNKVSMRMSDYGKLSRQLETWVSWCEENNVEYSVIKMEKWQDLGKLERHEYSEWELKELYATCECRNLPTIINNRLYNCPYAANAANLGAMTQDEISRDSIMLTGQISSSKEIEYFLYERPFLEACRYCNGRNFSRASIEPFIQTKQALPFKRRIDEKSVFEENDSEYISEDGKKVSIIVPVYNVEPYVEKCLHSIMKQTYKNIEILVIDDGSTDKSADICAKLAREDERIIYIRNEHKGVVCARNAGICRATGEYMMFVDADDWVEEAYVDSMIREMDGCDAVIAGHIVEGMNNEVSTNLMDRGQSLLTYVHVELCEGSYADDKMALIRKNMFKGSDHPLPPYLWGKVLKTDKIKQLYHLVDEKIFLSEDRVLTYLYLSNSHRAKIVGIMGYHYCRRQNSTGNKRYDYQRILENYERYYHCLNNNLNNQELNKYLNIDFSEWICYHLNYTYNLCDTQAGRMGYYPYYGRLQGKKVILYGAGNVGRLYRRHILQDKECTLIAWMDKNAKYYRETEQLEVESVENIERYEYDNIIIAVAIQYVYEEIRDELISMGVEADKILWNKTKWEL